MDVKRKIILKNKGKGHINNLTNAENIQNRNFLSKNKISDEKRKTNQLTLLNCNLNKMDLGQNESKQIQQMQYKDLLKIYENLQTEELKHYHKISIVQESIRKIKKKQDALKQKLATPVQTVLEICKEINEKTSFTIDPNEFTACLSFIESILKEPFNKEYDTLITIIKNKLKIDF